MLIGGEIPDLVSCIDVKKPLHVYAPNPAIFVCGGRVDINSSSPASLRGAFLRGAYDPPLDQYQIVLAEEANLVFPTGRYQDFFQFESDLAQIVDLIVLFSESFGSAAELGAFCTHHEISKNMLVIIDDKNHAEMSYISLGPLKYLQDKYGESATCVLNCDQININNISALENLNQPEFRRIVAKAISIRAQQTKPPTTFDLRIRGHIIKFITGLIQHYGALTLEEVSCYLFGFEIKMDDKTLRDFLLCADFVGWIKVEKRGLSTFYSTKNLKKEALSYKLRQEHSGLRKDGWRADIRSYWRQHDPDRFAAIQAALRS